MYLYMYASQRAGGRERESRTEGGEGLYTTPITIDRQGGYYNIDTRAVVYIHVQRNAVE